MYAYVTLVMRGDFYVPGAIVLGQSLMESGSTIDRVCMVTEDVSEHAVDILRLFYTHVEKVDYIKAKAKPLKTAKQNKKYSSWMGDSLTTYRCLGLERYHKVLFLDADVLVLRCMDEVFSIPAPAGTFDSYFLNKIRDPIYGQLGFGDRVPKEHIQHALQSGAHVAIGNCMLFETEGGKLLNAFIQYMDDFVNQHDSVGFHGSISSTNEQMICDFFACRTDWTQLDKRFQTIPWKELSLCEQPFLYHYFNTKPWTMDEQEWPDLKHWWDAARRAMRAQPVCVELFFTSPIVI